MFVFEKSPLAKVVDLKVVVSPLLSLRTVPQALNPAECSLRYNSGDV